MEPDLKAICRNCGCTYGSHLATSYYSQWYKRYFPRNSCPGTEGRMDWDKGAGTVFEPESEVKNGHETD